MSWFGVWLAAVLGEILQASELSFYREAGAHKNCVRHLHGKNEKILPTVQRMHRVNECLGHLEEQTVRLPK